MRRRAALASAAGLCIVCAALWGCGGSTTGTGSQGGARTGPGEDPPAGIAVVESTFRPSDYGLETWEDDSESPGAETPAAAGDPAGEASTDTVPGYRVQVIITEDIDAAASLRDSLANALPDEWVYLAYHAPYYKVRIGNYADRFAAGEMLEMLRRRGFPDAWVVPERILANPPPPPSRAVAPDSSG